MPGGAIVGLVVGVLLVLVLVTGAIVWACGTRVPCIDKGNSSGNGKAVPTPVPTYLNPSYTPYHVGGTSQGARGRPGSVA